MEQLTILSNIIRTIVFFTITVGIVWRGWKHPWKEWNILKPISNKKICLSIIPQIMAIFLYDGIYQALLKWGELSIAGFILYCGFELYLYFAWNIIFIAIIRRLYSLHINKWIIGCCISVVGIDVIYDINPLPVDLGLTLIIVSIVLGWIVAE